jgi:hypothetical protein
MSSKGQAVVLPNEQYLTPEGVAYAALRKLAKEYPSFQPATFLEPGCSWGIHCHAAQETFPTIEVATGLDILAPDESLFPLANQEFIRADYLTWETSNRYDLIVTNPPFSLSLPFMEKSISLLSDNGIACFLEKYSLLTSLKRIAWWRENKQRLLAVWNCVPRPRFLVAPMVPYGSSGDSCEYAYFLFCRSVFCKAKLGWLQWENTFSFTDRI